jgi:hypothetical protein
LSKIPVYAFRVFLVGESDPIIVKREVSYNIRPSDVAHAFCRLGFEVGNIWYPGHRVTKIEWEGLRDDQKETAG